MAKKNEPVLIRTTLFGSGENIIKGQLFSVSPTQSLAVISAQTVKEVESKRKEKIATTVKELLIRPKTEGLNLKNAEITTRVKLVDEYLKNTSVQEALQQVGKEVIKGKKQELPKLLKPKKAAKNAKDETKKKVEAENKKIQAENKLIQAEIDKIKEANKKVDDTVISWQPRIEKDLKFPIEKYYVNKPGFEEIEVQETEKEYSYKEIETWTFYFKIRPRDAVRHMANYINLKKLLNTK